MLFPAEASITGVQVSGPEAISSVKIRAFQWPFGAAVVCCWVRVRFCARRARLEAGKGCCRVFLQNRNLIKLFIDWMA